VPAMAGQRLAVLHVRRRSAASITGRWKSRAWARALGGTADGSENLASLGCRRPWQKPQQKALAGTVGPEQRPSPTRLQHQFTRSSSCLPAMAKPRREPQRLVGGATDRLVAPARPGCLDPRQDGAHDKAPPAVETAVEVGRAFRVRVRPSRIRRAPGRLEGAAAVSRAIRGGHREGCGRGDVAATISTAPTWRGTAAAGEQGRVG
jgi:hypothetical protein